MKSNAVWVVEPHKLAVRPLEVPDPAWDEVQIQVKACGICALDLALFQGKSASGPMPYVLGHEAVGVICKIGAGVRDFKIGDKVYAANGGDNRQMSQYINNPVSGIGKIPDDVTDYTAWVLEPACCVVNLLLQADIQPGDRVVLVGAGYMGLLTLMGLSHTLAGEITVLEPRESSRNLAEAYRPDGCFDPDSEEGRRSIARLRASGGADVVIEFSNSDAGYELATKLVREQGGKLVLGSWYRHPMSFDGDLWHLSGLKVLNASPMMNRLYNETVVRQTGLLVRRGVFEPKRLISHVLRYDDPALQDLFEDTVHKRNHYMKGIVLFDP